MSAGHPTGKTAPTPPGSEEHDFFLRNAPCPSSWRSGPDSELGQVRARLWSDSGQTLARLWSDSGVGLRAPGKSWRAAMAAEFVELL